MADLPKLFFASYALLWVLALTLIPTTIAFLHIYRRSERLASAALRMSKPVLEVGEAFPGLEGRDLASDVAASTQEFRGSPRLYLAVQPGCPACGQLISELVEYTESAPKQGCIVILCFGKSSICKEVLGGLRGVNVLQMDWQHARRIASGLPAAFAVDREGVVIAVHRGATSAKHLIRFIQNEGEDETHKEDEAL